MIRYKIEEICGDWAIYEVRETETEGGEQCLLILDSRSNAEYIKAILEHEAQNPDVAVPYRPEVADMSDEEVVAIFRVCSSGMSEGCERCPLRDAEECFGKIDERILGMAERYVELKKEPVLAHHPKPYEKEIEELTCDMCDSCREAVTREDCPNHCCDDVRQHAEALYARGWRRQSEGEWLTSDIPQEKYVCSICGGACWYYDCQGEVARSRYCPNCGARMKGGAE